MFIEFVVTPTCATCKQFHRGFTRCGARIFSSRLALPPSTPATRRKALGVGNEYVQLKRLSDFVQGGLLDNIREEEERRAAAKARAAARRAEEAKEGQEGSQLESES